LSASQQFNNHHFQAEYNYKFQGNTYPTNTYFGLFLILFFIKKFASLHPKNLFSLTSFNAGILEKLPELKS
jgi:hypothetical protein